MTPQRADENAVRGAAAREHLIERPARPLPGPVEVTLDLRDESG